MATLLLTRRLECQRTTSFHWPTYNKAKGSANLGFVWPDRPTKFPCWWESDTIVECLVPLALSPKIVCTSQPPILYISTSRNNKRLGNGPFSEVPLNRTRATGRVWTAFKHVVEDAFILSLLCQRGVDRKLAYNSSPWEELWFLYEIDMPTRLGHGTCSSNK